MSAQKYMHVVNSTHAYDAQAQGTHEISCRAKQTKTTNLQRKTEEMSRKQPNNTRVWERDRDGYGECAQIKIKLKKYVNKSHSAVLFSIFVGRYGRFTWVAVQMFNIECSSPSNWTLNFIRFAYRSARHGKVINNNRAICVYLAYKYIRNAKLCESAMLDCEQVKTSEICIFTGDRLWSVLDQSAMSEACVYMCTI